MVNAAKPECDLLQTMFEGNASLGEFSGVRLRLLEKAAYLKSLATMGVILEATFQSMILGAPDSWRIVQRHFQPSLDNALARTQLFNQQCKDALWPNLRLNTAAILRHSPAMSLKPFALAV